MPAWARDKCVYIPENGVDPDCLQTSRSRPARIPLKAAFVGRLVPYKGADILLEAAAELLRNNRVHAVIAEVKVLPVQSEHTCCDRTARDQMVVSLD